MNKSYYKNFFWVLPLLLLYACGINDQTNSSDLGQPATMTDNFAVIGTTDYTGSGAHAVINLEAPRTAQINLGATSSKDVGIACNGQHLYRIERLNWGANGSIVKFSINEPAQPIYQYSVDDLDPASQSNPTDIVFVTSTKAYLLRNMNNKIWIINPSATTEAEFKTGEIDISAYSPDGGITPPRVSKGIIVGNKLFILLLRLDAFYAPSNDSYLAVFNTNTNQEIDTGYGLGGLKGIKLDVRNPYGRLVLNNNTLYIAGTIFPDDPNPLWPTTTWTDYKSYSGIQKINAVTYEPDHDIIYKAVNTITYFDVVSPSKGYFVEYLGYANTALRSFNPTTGSVSSGNVAGIGDSGDRDISDIALDSKGKLWIADFSIAYMGMHILDTASDTIEEGAISTGLNPVAIAFCEK